MKQFSLQAFVFIVILPLSACYLRGGPTLGYTHGRGLSYGIDAAAGAFVIGPRMGWVSRPSLDVPATEESDAVATDDESVSYYGVDLGLFGLGALSLGGSHSDQTDWDFYAGADVHPGVIYNSTMEMADANDSSPFGYSFSKEWAAFLYVGARYVGGELEFYSSPQAYFLGACVNACQ